MITHLDRDSANRTRADLLGLALTIAAAALGGMLRGNWILIPAGYWTVILLLRLAALTKERRTNETDERGAPRQKGPSARSGENA